MSDTPDTDPREPQLLARLQRLTRWRTPSARWRRVIQVVAAAIFLGGVVVSLRQLEIGLAQVTWWPLVLLAVVGTPLTIAVNAAELRVMAACLGAERPLGWGRAVRVVVLATAANVLPIPGGAMVRIQALRATGATTGRATAINLVAALLWVAVAVGIAGVAAWAYAPVAAGVALLGALAGIGVSFAGLRASAGPGARTGIGRNAVALLAVETATTLLHAAKLYLALLALGIVAGFDQALVLGVAGPVSAAAGVFPSGLGLAELLAALTATLVALAPAAGFSATALVRVVGLASTAPLVLAIGDAREDLTRPG